MVAGRPGGVNARGRWRRIPERSSSLTFASLDRYSDVDITGSCEFTVEVEPGQEPDYISEETAAEDWDATRPTAIA